MDNSNQIVEQFNLAKTDKAGLVIVGGDTHSFLCPGRSGHKVMMTQHCGIIDYQPAELVVRVRAGTSVQELRQALEEKGQMLPFEPQECDGASTIGGVIATALAGPRRGYVGGVSDYVLGLTLLNGHGEILRFGGQVIKNVAGFDVSRFVVGGYGLYGVILDVSLKVLPIPAVEKTYKKSIAENELPEFMASLRGFPLSASSYQNNELHVRLSSVSEDSVEVFAAKTAAAEVQQGSEYWYGLRERKSAFFADATSLYQCLLPATAQCQLSGDMLTEWHGSKRWLANSTTPINDVVEQLQRIGGHMAVFKSVAEDDRAPKIFAVPLAVQKLQKRLRESFDSEGVFNRGQTAMPWLELD